MADLSDSRTKASRTLLSAPCDFNLAETSRMREIALGLWRRVAQAFLRRYAVGCPILGL